MEASAVFIWSVTDGRIAGLWPLMTT